jgi:hypothetical protein
MAKRLIRTVGGKHIVLVHRDAEWNEYRVSYRDAPKDRREATAYYTSDKGDAIDTANAMALQEEGWS